MASTGNELRFRWNDHMLHISKVLTLQRFEEQFCDVTLVSDDGFVMKAHQAILASTSGYFQRVFANITTDQHPMIVLPGANSQELSCILDYMYQGNTQVHQSLMDKVLEVADMLEVKGLSQIRSNNSIKKFMVPSSASATVTNATPLAHSPPLDSSNSSLGHLRSPDEQQASHTTEDQMYCESQSRSSELESSSNWMRLSGNVASETRSKEHSQLEEPTTPTVEPPPPSHTRTLACQDSSSQEVQEETQVSGMDLSMAKNEPWSPRESLGLSNKESPSRKRRKLQDGICTEETFEPISESDWGRTGPKNDDQTSCQPRTISFTSITSEGDINVLQSSNASSKSKEDLISTKPLVEKTLEVPCVDGPLTISLTTGQDLNGWRGIVKRKPLFSLPLRRARRKAKLRRTLDENRKKWLAKERRSLFGSESGGRPVTRALERLKNKAASSEDQSLDKLRLNCDLPFPTEGEKNSRDKENILSPKPTAEGNVKMPATQKGTTENNNETASWDDSNKKSGTEKLQDSNEELKFPAINPLSLFTLPPVKEREKQTRTTLTLEEKVKVIDAFLDGKSQRQIAHLYGIGKTQVSGIIKRREEILTIYRDSLLRGEKLTMKRQRKSEYALLNQHLIQWYRHMSVVAGVKITTGMLRAKALQIAPELGYHDFKASNGWLATFKANNNLKFSKQRKNNETYDDDQGNYEHDSNHRGDDEESYFEDAEADNSSSHLPLVKQYPGTSNVATGITASHDGTESDLTGNNKGGSQNEDSSSANQTDQTGTLIHPGLSAAAAAAAGASKAPQMVNTTLGANLTAAYNLSRDLTRDLTRGDTASVGDLSTTTMNASPLNHPVSALNVSRAVIENPLAKPSDALATYKSEEPIGYGYDHQNRMNDASTRGAEYNYTPYGFPGSYYSYHFLGQY